MAINFSQWHSVASSNVDAIAYDEASHTMGVRFKGGGTYEYEGVSPDVFSDAMGAPSIGAFMHNDIIGVYKHTRVG